MVGAGGNGSIFITHLCRILMAWRKLGGNEIKVTLFDPDVVTEANLARQVFCEADLGLPKALVLAQRMQAFFGLDIGFKVQAFNSSSVRYPIGDTDLIVGCVDSIKARRAIHESIQPLESKVHQWGEDRPHKEPGRYWLDLGNNDHSGQVVLGGHGLPTLFDVMPGLAKQRDPKDLPSCSLAEALERQDLFINSTIATLAGNLLWKMLRQGALTHHGYFVNLNSGRVAPIEVPAETTTP